MTGSDYGAHDALEDVLALQRLVKDSDIDISESTYQNGTFSVEFMQLSLDNSKRVRKNLPSLQPLIRGYSKNS